MDPAVVLLLGFRCVAHFGVLFAIALREILRYNTKGEQTPAKIFTKPAEGPGTCVHKLISGNKSEKAKTSLKNAELLQRFKEIDTLPEQEQNILLKVISAYIRAFKAKQAYAQ
jgi:hypothetical protein